MPELVAEDTGARKLYLLDGTANIFRAFYAIRRLTSPANKPTNATFGFTQMVRKLLQEENPEYLAVVFDRPEPTHRHRLFPKYKANRMAPPEDLVQQIPDVKEVCDALGLPRLEMAGFEADDLMGALARQASRDGYQVVIVSSDKDLLQLVGGPVSVLHPVKGERLDAEGVRRVFGVPPEQVVEVLALMGDSSDNVPGVPGIGEKGAKELISRYGTLEGCFEHASEIARKSYREGLEKNRELALASRDLVRIRLDAPVTWEPVRFRRREPRLEEARRLFRELGFTRLLDDLETAGQVEPGTPETQAAGPTGDSRVEEVESAELLGSLVEEALAVRRLAVVPVLSVPEAMRAELLGVALAVDPARVSYVSFAARGAGALPGVPRGEALRELAPAFAGDEVMKISDNIKQLKVILLRQDMALAGEMLDTTLAAYLLDSERRDYSLPALERTYLLRGGEAAPPPRGGQRRSKAGLERGEKVLAKEAGSACRLLLELADPLLHRLRESNLLKLYREVEIPLLAVLAAMERTGVRVDVKILEEISREWRRNLKEIEERIHFLAGSEFNINSPQQLREILFQRLGLKPGRKTEKEKQLSTGMDVLEDLAGSHPLPAAILEYRSLAKLLSTYVDALPRLVNPETGRVHASFNQSTAATGRLSSSNPNLQNIPVRSERGKQIRKAFVAEDGWRILTADYSQIELRVLAHLSGDPEMIRAFRQGEDIHTRTASRMFGVPPEEVTVELRRQAKAINFGIVYGMGAFRLAKELGVPQGAAQGFIDDYFRRFSGVKRYIDEVVERAEREGRVFTLFNRTRPVPEIQSRNANLRRQGIRIAVNTTVQGTAADLIKVAMVRLSRALESRRLRSRLLIQVHDELLLEVPEAEEGEVRELVREAMEHVHPLDVPLLAEVRTGPNWMETG